MKKIFILSILVFFTIGAQATKGNKDLITIQITPDHYDWNYKIGEPAHFTISLFRDQQKLNNIKIEYAVGPEKMVPIQKDSVLLKNGSVTIKSPGMQQPGFLSGYGRRIFLSQSHQHRVRLRTDTAYHFATRRFPFILGRSDLPYERISHEIRNDLHAGRE